MLFVPLSLVFLSGLGVADMLDALPQIFDFFKNLVREYWILITGSSVLAAFLALSVMDRIFHIFDIIRR